MSYVSLHNHSHFSLFDGYSKIPDLVKHVVSLGQSAVSLTDHGTLSGILPFYKECKKHNVKPVIGCEFYFTPDVTIRDRSRIFHLIVLAKNNTGYRNLLQLDTAAYRNFYYKPRIDIEMLMAHKDGLIVTSACMGSILNTPDADYWLQKFLDIFKENFYLEIQSNTMSDQKIYNEKICTLSKKYNVPLIITSDAHYPAKEDAKYHRLWVNLNKGENDYYPTNDFFVQSEDDVYTRVPELPRETVSIAIKNTGLIADKCNVDIEVQGNHYPVFPVADEVSAVKEICEQGWKKKVLPSIPKSNIKGYKTRLKRELAILKQCNYLNYLLITRDILNWCKENNIMTGVGRGSVAGSLLCYLMDITKIDPMPHGLLFERFVNPERKSSADKYYVERNRNITC